MSKYKVIFTGPVGAGKTTAINSITDAKNLLTDAPVSDITSQRKETTTVAMDYGFVQLDEQTSVHVYGTPGQERFDFMWDILVKGAHGLVLLMDNSRKNPYRDLKYYLDAFKHVIEKTALVIGVTRTDVKTEPPLEAYQQWLRELNVPVPVFFIDAREKDNVLLLLRKLVQAKPVGKIGAERTEQVSVDPIQEKPKTTKLQTHKASDGQAQTTGTDNGNDNNSSKDGSAVETYTSIPVTSSVDTATKDTPYYEANDHIQLDLDILKTVAQIKGVSGVTLTSDMGELLHSTIDDDQLNEFIAFLSGLTPVFDESLNIGKIKRIMLKGPNDENLTVFVEHQQALGVQSMRQTSVPALSQQVQDMLQWA